MAKDNIYRKNYMITACVETKPPSAFLCLEIQRTARKAVTRFSSPPSFTRDRIAYAVISTLRPNDDVPAGITQQL